jgi:hypothetical protein
MMMAGLRVNWSERLILEGIDLTMQVADDKYESAPVKGDE